MAMNQQRKGRGLSQTQAAAILLVPFLAVYGAFLVYPFFHGVWISLHDWNLLAVAFNPDAREFVGAENYVRTLWGRNIEWGPLASPVMQTVGVLGIGLAFFGFSRGAAVEGHGACAGDRGVAVRPAAGVSPGRGRALV